MDRKELLGDGSCHIAVVGRSTWSSVSSASLLIEAIAVKIEAIETRIDQIPDSSAIGNIA